MGNLAIRPAPEELQQLIYQLRGELAEKTEEIEALRSELREAQNAVRSQARLRQILTPLYTGLQEVFGVLPAARDVSSPPIAEQETSHKWEAWKRKLGGKAAEFITELLVHGEMTGQQLKVATRCGQQTVYDTIAKLNKAQLLNKNGNKYSLKEL